MIAPLVSRTMKKLAAALLLAISVFSLIGASASPASAMKKIWPIIVCVKEPCP